MYKIKLMTNEIGDALGAITAGPSIFGQLLLLGSLYNERTQRYEHDLGYRFGEDVVHSRLKHLHLVRFLSWLNLSLQSQSDDFAAFRADRPNTAAATAETLARGAVPLSALPVERELFIANLGLIGAILK